MAFPSQSNRSPSPIHTKHTNSNSRNTENTPLLRRSLSSGNSSNPLPKPSILTNHRRFEPTTPVNSPSDFRRSTTKESSGLGPSSLKGCEEKENGATDHNIKDCKLQSQAKGSKNFMSPTISAASKFTPSPRKKVLVERDDPVRTSMSLSNGKATFFSTVSRSVSENSELKSEMGNEKIDCSLNSADAEPEKNDLVREDPPLPKPVKRVTFYDVSSDSQHDTVTLSESAVADPDSPNMKSSLKDKVPCSNVLPSIASLDADPFPPYDPITNYLSPRPRFLHYKPNPRTEMLSTVGKNLKTELTSENLSDSESSEESQSEDSSEKGDSDAATSADSVLGMEETEVDLLVNETSESLPVSTDLSDDISDETKVPKAEKKSWALSKLAVFSILMMIVIVGVSMSVANPPVLEVIVPKDLRFSDLKVKLDWIAGNVHRFSVNSVIYMSKTINELQRGKELGPLRYMNLTDLQKNPWVVNQFLNNDMIGKEAEENNDEDESENDVMEMNEVLLEEVESYVEVNSDENFENEFRAPDDIPESDETYPDILDNAQDEEITIVNNDLIRDEHPQDESAGGDVSLPDQENESVVEMIEADALAETNFESINVDANVDSTAYSGDSISLSHSEQLDISSSTEDVFTLVKKEYIITPENLPGKPLSRHAMGICCVFATTLLALAVFVIRYKKIPGSTNVVVQDDRSSLSAKKEDQDMTLSRNSHTEVEYIEESCSSEMISLRKKSASYTKKDQTTRTASEIKKAPARSSSRRESLASSSSEFSFSPSYGSFTTFERIPIKDANGEEEFLTPVRRSSRIRNHQQIMSS